MLGPLLFLIIIGDFDKDVSASKLISFADDTRLYNSVGDVTDCDTLDGGDFLHGSLNADDLAVN